MKKVIAFTVGLLLCSLAFAQLGAPKITVRDTSFVLKVTYNGSELAEADWPCDLIIEDAVKITVAGFNYTKGKPTYSKSYQYMENLNGHADYSVYDGLCNGKKEKIMIAKLRKDCNSEVETIYSIGDYVFYTQSLASAKDLIFKSLVPFIPDEDRERLQQLDETEFKEAMIAMESNIGALLETLELTKDQKTITRMLFKDSILKIRNSKN